MDLDPRKFVLTFGTCELAVKVRVVLRIQARTEELFVGSPQGNV